MALFSADCTTGLALSKNNVHFIIRRKTNEKYIPPEEPAMTVCVEGDEIRLEEFVKSKRTVKVHGRAD